MPLAMNTYTGTDQSLTEPDQSRIYFGGVGLLPFPLFLMVCVSIATGRRHRRSLPFPFPPRPASSLVIFILFAFVGLFKAHGRHRPSLSYCHLKLCSFFPSSFSVFF